MSEFQAVIDSISPERLLHWLSETVDTYGPTWAEGPALLVFEDMLNALELPYRKQAVDEERYNLIVEVGPQPPSLMWVGHVDTVGLYDEEHRGVRVEGDLLYGLGSADMKSGCVAAVEALAAVVRSGIELKQGLRLALVVGEEEYGDGSEKLLNWCLRLWSWSGSQQTCSHAQHITGISKCSCAAAGRAHMRLCRR